MYEVRQYATPAGRNLYLEWLQSLRDGKTQTAISRRVLRLALGNFGDHKFCRQGVWVLRINYGPGYRVYYGMLGTQIVLLLCGGDKSSQAADIDRACNLFRLVKES